MADGLDGLSAYELALAAGFRGTVKEWLASLAGAPGRDGMAGKDGRNGIDGKDGQSIQGPAGKDGRDGRDGIDGKDGAPGKDASLPPPVSWFAAFEFGADDRTRRIEVTPSNPTGRQPWEIVPIRDDFGRAVAATINPIQA